MTKIVSGCKLVPQGAMIEKKLPETGSKVTMVHVTAT